MRPDIRGATIDFSISGYCGLGLFSRDLAGLDADGVPGLPDGALLHAVGAVQFPGDVISQVGAILEPRILPQPVAQSHIPDLPGALPGEPAKPYGQFVKGLVRNAGV